MSMVIPAVFVFLMKFWLQIKNQTDINAKSLGNKKLKGVDGEVTVYQVASGVKSETQISFINKDKVSGKPWSLAKKILFPLTGLILTIIGGAFWFIYPFITLGTAHERDYDASIAILYMENISSEENSYFADGLTEELITRLSRIQNLKVRPRTDVAFFKNKTATMAEISKKLSVNYIVEGTVKIIGDDLRVNVLLFDIEKDNSIWSESYSNTLKDILNVQDEIARSIVSKLNEKLTINKSDLIATKRKPTENLEAYKLMKECYLILDDNKLAEEVIAKKVTPFAEKAILLDSTYADAYAVLALGKLMKHMNDDISDEAIKDNNEAILLAEKALFYDPDNELATAETILIPAFQMRAKKYSDKTFEDLFLIRQLTIRMDRAIRKFPDSPFFLSIGGMYFSLIYQITDDITYLEKALSLLTKSHSILKNSFSESNDFLANGAKGTNFEIIPFTYSLLEDSNKASEFLISNKNMICEDGTYECQNIWRLRDYTNYFYNSYHYNEALETIELMLDRSDEELAYEGEKNDDIKVQFYFKSGMIHMKRGNIDIAIDHYNNALEIISQSEEDLNYWLYVINSKLGFTYYYNKDFENASSYFLRAQSFYNPPDEEEKTQKMSLKCYHGLSELLTGNLDTSEKAIHTAESWLKEHPLNKEDHYDYDAYLLYWPLHIYYDKLNQSDKANKYLKMAYEIVDQKQIDKYNNHSEKDTYPEFFYCRDIIKAYESNLNQ